MREPKIVQMYGLCFNIGWNYLNALDTITLKERSFGMLVGERNVEVDHMELSTGNLDAAVDFDEYRR